MTTPYTRPEVSEDDKAKIQKFAQSLINSRNTQRILATLMALMYENARLTAECNEHRAALGIEPLPIHDTPKG